MLAPTNDLVPQEQVGVWGLLLLAPEACKGLDLEDDRTFPI